MMVLWIRKVNWNLLDCVLNDVSIFCAKQLTYGFQEFQGKNNNIFFLFTTTSDIRKRACHVRF